MRENSKEVREVFKPSFWRRLTNNAVFQLESHSPVVSQDTGFRKGGEGEQIETEAKIKTNKEKSAELNSFKANS